MKKLDSLLSFVNLYFIVKYKLEIVLNIVSVKIVFCNH